MGTWGSQGRSPAPPLLEFTPTPVYSFACGLGARLSVQPRCLLSVTCVLEKAEGWQCRRGETLGPGH